MTYQLIDNIPVWGQADDNTIQQIKNCRKDAAHVALMADNHLGYAVPIGGVVDSLRRGRGGIGAHPGKGCAASTAPHTESVQNGKYYFLPFLTGFLALLDAGAFTAFFVDAFMLFSNGC